MTRYRAAIQERGNGFAGVGEYVATSEGDVYRIVDELDGLIQTGRSPGAPNFYVALVEAADWDDITDDNEPYCTAVIIEDVV